jgi:hypothetical protein
MNKKAFFTRSSLYVKRLLVNFESSLLLTIICKCTKHYNNLQTHLYLIQTNLHLIQKHLHLIQTHLHLIQTHLHLIQTNLQTSKLLKIILYRYKIIKNAKLIKAWIKLKLFIDLGLNK